MTAGKNMEVLRVRVAESALLVIIRSRKLHVLSFKSP